MKKTINELIKKEKRYLRELKSFSKNNPNKGEIFKMLGIIYDQKALKSKLKKKFQEKAKFYFQKALKYKKVKRDALRGLGTVFMHQGNYKKALYYYLKAHRMKRDADTYNDLGNLYRKMKQFKKAENFYKKGLKIAKRKEKDLYYKFIISAIQKNLNLLKIQTSS